MPVRDNYILPGQSDHDRLRVISDMHDRATRQLLKEIRAVEVEIGANFGVIASLVLLA